ncbi:hypothetical protein PHMEG_0007687 [Phytophthora megakarya]|uniref:Uncharacterized protein n=1 Tax=Phytophthora megakarya TaxID=4795 RepID=A0A225WMX7_9STRA|nr:hypothetical protein PHMEG_0007687 [Phytophthora megakarya]
MQLVYIGCVSLAQAPLHFRKETSTRLQSTRFQLSSETGCYQSKKRLVYFEMNPARPSSNKALDRYRLGLLLAEYPHLSTLQQIALHGIKPSWRDNHTSCPKELKHHLSFQRNLSAALKCIRDGQDNGKFLVVDADLLSNGHLPFGAVEKADVDPKIEVRLFHDLSSPPGLSTNDYLYKIAFQISITMLARRIEMLDTNHPGHTIRILKGDVKGAFRHLMTHAKHVHWMAGLVRERNALVIDLAALFGWPESPQFYAVFGRAISWLVEQNYPA